MSKKMVEKVQKLFISAHTVNSHHKNILRKTDSKSTTELATKVIKEGLL